MEQAGTGRSGVSATAVLWWAATIATLVVLDDLTFGPFFWLLSRLAGPVVAVLAVYAVYVPAQIMLVRQATVPNTSRLASFLLDRLDVARRSERVAANEMQLRRRVVGATSAVLMSLLIAGVLPCLLLWRQGYPRPFVRRLSVVTSVVYSTEFALLHGLLPSLV